MIGKTFTIGTEYSCRSICNYDTIFSFTVTKRTAKFITIVDKFGEVARVGVRIDSDGNEYASPMGSYSMSPIIRASEVAA